MDGNVLKGEYVNAHEKNFLQVPALPSLNDDDGSVALTDDDGILIDHFQYSKSWHSVFSKMKKRFRWNAFLS